MDEKTLTRDLAQAVQASGRFTIDASGRLHRYEAGVYRPDGELFVRRLVKRFLLEDKKAGKWTVWRGNQVVEFMRLDAPELPKAPCQDVINLANGLLNIWTGELSAHSPDFLSVIQVPVSFNSDARCPMVEWFLEETVPRDCIELCWEILGDLLTPDRSIQKAILLIGEGGNGKGVYAQLATNFVGPDNVSNLSLQKLESDRFAVARLYGKLANICADLPSEHLTNSSVFKSITGCDRITGEFKYHDSFEFTPFCRLLFSANQLPVTRDASTAFFSRWLVIPFERRFRGTDLELPRSVIDGWLSTPEELSGMLNKALPALRKVRSSGKFSETATTRMAGEEFEVIMNPVAQWLASNTITSPDGVVAQDRLHAAYARECAEHERPVMTKQMLGRSLKRLLPQLETAQRVVDGRRQWVYVGLELKP